MNASMAMPTSDQVIELDWKAYFEEFQNLHGGEPVTHKPTGRLLFRDGWMYSATDYMGPEWEPPKEADRLKQLLKDYWTERRAIIFTMLESVRGKIADIQQMQRERSAPLQRVIYIKTEEGKTLKQSSIIDTAFMEARLTLLEDALGECVETLKQLNQVEAPQ